MEVEVRFRILATALSISVLFVLLFSQAAQAQCYNNAGAPVACPGEKEKKKHTTATPLPTPVATSTRASVAVAPLLPPVGGQIGAGGAGNPAAGQPAPTQIPLLLPGLLGLIIIVALIGAILLRRRILVRSHAGTSMPELGHNLGLSHDPGDGSFDPSEISIDKPSRHSLSKKHDDAPTGYPADPCDDSLTFKESVQADNTGNLRENVTGHGVQAPWEEGGDVDSNSSG
jgi:hypothetical protein